MLRPLSSFLCLAAVTLAVSVPAAGQDAPPASERREDAEWVTLGTRGGPLASATRSQPANLLWSGGGLYLVETGDGASGQLAKAGVATAQLTGVFISHLHFDH